MVEEKLNSLVDDAPPTLFKKDGKGKFAKGHKSPGRPRGSKNKISLMLEKLFEDEAEDLVRKVIEMALKGDMTALKLCVERLVPVKKDRAIPYNIGNLMDMHSSADIMLKATNALLDGEIAESQINSLSKAIDQTRQCYELTHVIKRLDTLEESIKHNNAVS